MAKTLEELRAQFKGPETSNRPNNYYPFWNMKEGEQAIVRFLPDKDQDNPLGFMVEKLMHTLEINGKRVNVPCGKMYGEECPICKVSAAYYKDDDKDNGKKYWRKKQHVVQALIIEDPLAPDAETGEKHEGKVRFMTLSYQLFNIIKAAFESGELDEIPYAYEGGCNFVIKKTKQGEYATYAVGSNFARKATDLTDDEIAVAEDGMVELGTLLPANPGIEKLESMLEASMNGTHYDEGESSSSMTFKKKEAPVAEEEAPAAKKPTPKPKKKAAEPEEDDGTSDAASILAKIRARETG